MRIFVLFTAFVLLLPLTAMADWTYNEIRKAVKDKVPYPELAALEQKHMNRIIRGEGYVFEVRESTSVNGIDLHLLEDYADAEKAFMGDVSIEVLKGSPVYKVVKKLKPGQEVSFSGRIDDIFGKTIYIRGTVSVTPE
jgi:hypothetical protein